jgi:TPR repeat protein
MTLRAARTALIAAAITLGILVAPIAATPAAADPYQDGKAAWLAQDYARAWALWKPLADQGNPDGENGIGILFDEGEGVPADSAAAETWFRRAEAHGSAKATYNLGRQYMLGHGRPIDVATALRYYERAASSGLVEAQSRLAMTYYSGEAGLAPDHGKAALWFRKAADNGDAYSRYMLGLMSEYGLGLNRSTVAAYAWLSYAMESHDDTTVRWATHERAWLSRDIKGQQLTALQNSAAKCRQAAFEDCADGVVQ